MPRIYAVTGFKGGAGKSTVATNLAAEHLARGRRVLLVDADPQGTSSAWSQIAQEQGHAAPTTVQMGATMHRPDQLPRLAEPFDVVIIDGPPRFGDVQRSMLLVADVALLPCPPSTPDVWAVSQGVELVCETQSRMRPDLIGVVALVRTMPRASIVASSRDALRGCGLPLLEAELGQRVAYPEALAAGLGVTTYEPSSSAAVELRTFVDELETLQAPKAALHVA